MDGGYILLIAIVFGILLIISQRVITKHKRMFRGFIVSMGILLMCRYDSSYQIANLIGYMIAIVISFLFWFFVGRYNPVNDADEIKVYGLND
jgi:Ca2+/Na+ antiporter